MKIIFPILALEEEAIIRLFYCKSCSYLFLLIMVFSITACGGGNNNDIHQNSVCEQGINNTVCSSDFLEDSVWGLGPINIPVEIAGLSQDVEMSHFYRFYSANQTYEHYLFLKVLSTNSYFTERRYGNITLLNDSKEIEFSPIESSCNGEDSIFSIFDQSDEKLEVVRNADTLFLSIPTTDNYLDDYLNSIALKVESVEDFVLLPYRVLYFAMVAFISIVLDLFTPEFIESFVTGALGYDENTMIHFQERYDNRIEGCFSAEGISRFIKN